MDSRIKKVTFREGKVSAIMDNGNLVQLFDFSPKLPPFQPNDIKGMTLVEAFEFKRILSHIPPKDTEKV